VKIGILGTGAVGKVIGKALVAKGHEVRLGAREAGNASAAGWAAEVGPRGTAGTFADAAAFGELLFNCTSGVASLAALERAGAANLAGKVLIDVANPLDFSQGFPPTLSVANTDSLAEQLQRAFPATKVVKALNTMNCELMVDAGKVPGTDVFVAGDDPAARASVKGLLREAFGWEAPIDLGGLRAARGLEMWLPLWLSVYGALGTGTFNVKIVRG
jgi:predicted dinucleotide-binding enzyme